MKIIVFDKYLGYQVGGAQNSLHFLLKNLNADFKFLGCNVKKSFSAGKYILDDWQVERINITELPKFPYIEYWLNRKKIGEFILSQGADLLMAQGLWGAIAVKFFNGKSIYFIRDEYHFDRIPIYQGGVKKYLKKIYLLLQYPIIRRILKDNGGAIRKADLVIANSRFIAGQIENIFNKKTEFIYPLINVGELKDIEIPEPENREFITSIGSEYMKGDRIVEMIAKSMPDYKFMIIGRNIKKPFWKENILYHPWVKNVIEIYGRTKILLVPSICQDAFCSGGVKAMALGIPCIGSKIGGIPEVLDEEFLIDDIWNIEKWKNKILEIEKNYGRYPSILKEKAVRFDASLQIEKFKKIVKEELGLDL